MPDTSGTLAGSRGGTPKQSAENHRRLGVVPDFTVGLDQPSGAVACESWMAWACVLLPLAPETEKGRQPPFKQGEAANMAHIVAIILSELLPFLFV